MVSPSVFNMYMDGYRRNESISVYARLKINGIRVGSGGMLVCKVKRNFRVVFEFSMHKVTCKGYERKRCIYGANEWFEEHYSLANTDVWITDLDME